MQRYNAFSQLHKGLSAMLYHTTTILQQTDFTNTEESRHALEKVRQAKLFFEQYNRLYITLAESSIYKHEPMEAASFEEKSGKITTITRLLADLTETYDPSMSADDKNEIGITLTTTFVSFMISNLELIPKRESILNNILWKYYTDDQLKTIVQSIIASTPDKELLSETLWIIRGTNNTEIIGWFKSVRNTISDPALNSLIDMAESELPQCRWEKIQQGLAEGVMLES